MLNGTLRFSRSILEDEGEISISENHYQQVASPGSDLTEASNMAFSSIDSSKKWVVGKKINQSVVPFFYQV